MWCSSRWSWRSPAARARSAPSPSATTTAASTSPRPGAGTSCGCSTRCGSRSWWPTTRGRYCWPTASGRRPRHRSPIRSQPARTTSSAPSCAGCTSAGCSRCRSTVSAGTGSILFCPHRTVGGWPWSATATRPGWTCGARRSWNGWPGARSCACGRASSTGSRTWRWRRCGSALRSLACCPPRDVPEVVHGVVDEVPGERLDGEPRAVAAVAGALPLVAPHALERRGEALAGLGQLVADGGRILFAVALGDGGRVLVPVGVGGTVLGEHQVEPVRVEPVHVAHMARVLQRRPLVGPRPGAYLVGGAGQHVPPGDGVRAQQRGYLLAGEGARVEAALGARLAQHPGPVLGIRNDRHASKAIPDL